MSSVCHSEFREKKEIPTHTHTQLLKDKIRKIVFIKISLRH